MVESAQRAYRAPCPGCGAPVEFRSAQSTHAVCPFCRSTVVRQGETLARIGKMAELFDDFSPLQLLAAGRIQDKPFTLVGRLQYSYPGGRWTEWIAALDGEHTGLLSEDNGAFVFSLPFALEREAPHEAELRVGATTAFNGQNYTVASNEQVALASAQGELPRLPELGRPFPVVELRNDKGLVLSLDYDTDPPGAYLGRAVRLEDLQLTGLRDESAKEEKGRSFNCPNCGAPVTANLADSKTITCAACSSIIDLSQGIGGELKHAEQDEPVRPLVPLGSVGQFQGVSWQVVGFQHRTGAEPGDDEHFGWNEYLLYNKKRGFSFLVDAEDGWSLVAPTTGAPRMAESGRTATYLGKTYQQQYAYNAETTYVAGEFYWQVERGQKTFNRDFASGASLLSMERSPNELTWSTGSKLDSAAVAAAFRLDARKDLFKRSDAAPLSAASGLGCGTIILIVVVILILLVILSTCSSRCDPRVQNCSSSRTSGGSFGGYSSGGGHK
jgi:DNA-directed RNA polymerase subunit RPC12/RpoP